MIRPRSHLAAQGLRTAREPWLRGALMRRSFVCPARPACLPPARVRRGTYAAMPMGDPNLREMRLVGSTQGSDLTTYGDPASTEYVHLKEVLRGNNCAVFVPLVGTERKCCCKSAHESPAIWNGDTQGYT